MLEMAIGDPMLADLLHAESIPSRVHGTCSIEIVTSPDRLVMVLSLRALFAHRDAPACVRTAAYRHGGLPGGASLRVFVPGGVTRTWFHGRVDEAIFRQLVPAVVTDCARTTDAAARRLTPCGKRKHCGRDRSPTSRNAARSTPGSRCGRNTHEWRRGDTASPQRLRPRSTSGS